MAKSLVLLGYLQYAPGQRKYRLAARVLGLGYAAMGRSDAQRVVRAKMQSFAEQHDVDVTLSAHDGLSMIVLESCASALPSNEHRANVGTRICLGSSPIGWALLAALPAIERYDLLDNVQQHMQRKRLRLLRRSCEAIAQAQERGFCTSLGEGDDEFAIVAAPLTIAGHAPLVLACSGPSNRVTRARMERELGPRLAAIAMELRQNSLAGSA
jgi:DNA-binding IclR family transcriptional regulator